MSFRADHKRFLRAWARDCRQLYLDALKISDMNSRIGYLSGLKWSTCNHINGEIREGLITQAEAAEFYIKVFTRAEKGT